MVVDVISGSPAEKAGFKVGDEIMSVANDISQNIQHYKSLLQSTYEHIKVIVKRDKDLVELTLRVKSIL